jgi:hypothetical protein
LLRLPVVADHAAMETEPPKADPPKRKRRWFQFSLRTLMIVVTLLAIPCGYVGWQAKIVRERMAMSECIKKVEHGDCWFFDEDLSGGVPWIRRLLGDKTCMLILVPGASDEEFVAIKAAFPEADLVLRERLP